jgi:hypothetical protein
MSKLITFEGLSGNVSSPQVSGDQLIVAKFNNLGLVVWMQLQGDSLSASTSDNNFDCGSSIKLDAANNIFVGGSLLDTTYIQSGSLVIKQFATICKYNNAGSLQWSKTFGNDKTDKIAAIDLDANGDVYAIGTYTNTFNVGGVVLPPDTNTTSFVAKFNSNNGNTVFACRNGTCISHTEGWGIGVNQQNGNVYTSGIYKGSNVFNNTITSVGGWDIYLSLLNNIVGPSNVNKLNNEMQFTLFPNPATDKLIVDANNKFSLSLVKATIYGMDGRVVLQSFLKHNTIDISALQIGNFILELKDGKNKSAKYFSKL